jgi:hypothetical protein
MGSYKFLLCADVEGFQFLDSPQTDTQGFCVHNGNVMVICFRGTESLQDWKTNLRFPLVIIT